MCDVAKAQGALPLPIAKTKREWVKIDKVPIITQISTTTSTTTPTIKKQQQYNKSIKTTEVAAAAAGAAAHTNTDTGAGTGTGTSTSTASVDDVNIISISSGNDGYSILSRVDSPWAPPVILDSRTRRSAKANGEADIDGKNKEVKIVISFQKMQERSRF
jgi:hypothetical protein